MSCVLEEQKLELIRELDPDGSAGLLDRMVEAYTDQAPRQVAGILDAALDGDLEMVAGLAHTLKSSSINLGAVELHERARRIEIAARDKQLEALGVDLRGLETELHKVLGALRALCV